jgi:hypothetical protein
MNQELKAQMRRYFEQKEYFEATTAILRMNITEQDMSDELLDSFDEPTRQRIYGLLRVWCKDQAAPIFERRAKREPQENQRRALKIMAHAAKQSWWSNPKPPKWPEQGPGPEPPAPRAE